MLKLPEQITLKNHADLNLSLLISKFESARGFVLLCFFYLKMENDYIYTINYCVFNDIFYLADV